LPNSSFDHLDHDAKTMIPIGIETKVVIVRALRDSGIREAMNSDSVPSTLVHNPRFIIHDSRLTCTYTHPGTPRAVLPARS
jgi:hypothetical protein